MSAGFRELGVAFAVFLAPYGALAQTLETDARAASVALASEAQQLADRGRPLEACIKYAESYSLDAQLDALLPLADCFEQNGKWASAYAAFLDAVRVARRAGDQRWVLAEQRATALAPRVSYLTIEVSHAVRLPALRVECDGFGLGSSSWGVPLPIDQGHHVLTASAPGDHEWQTTVDVQSAGAASSVEVPQLVKLANQAPEPASSEMLATPRTPSRKPFFSPAVTLPATSPPDIKLGPTRIAAVVANGISALGLGLGLGDARTEATRTCCIRDAGHQPARCGPRARW
jgi:hypothetical protein